MCRSNAEIEEFEFVNKENSRKIKNLEEKRNIRTSMTEKRQNPTYILS